MKSKKIKPGFKAIYWFCIIGCFISLFFKVSAFFWKPRRENWQRNAQLIIEEFVQNDEYVSWIDLGIDVRQQNYLDYSSDFAYIIAQFYAIPTVLENNLIHKKLICHFHDEKRLALFCEKFGYNTLCLVHNDKLALLEKK